LSCRVYVYTLDTLKLIFLKITSQLIYIEKYVLRKAITKFTSILLITVIFNKEYFLDNRILKYTCHKFKKNLLLCTIK